MSAHIVWFKRDLRVSDHRPLVHAAARAIAAGEVVVCLYASEPELLDDAEWSEAHTGFVDDCLRELDRALVRLGTRLTLVRGNFPAVLDDLARRLAGVGGIGGIWSHEETGGRVTFDRDKRVRRWCDANAVAWTEIPQHGVFRGLRDRDGWAARWTERMSEPPVTPPPMIPCISRFIETWDFGERASNAGARVRSSSRQPGGEPLAQETLATFLTNRGVNYRADMASPVSGFDGCSRLSPHLAWGSISIRTVHHALIARQRELFQTPLDQRDPRWLKSLSSFQARLRWQSHFIQKLESEPAIEHRNMHRAYDNLRRENRDAWNEQETLRFEAWRTGRTGYPFVDASMRCLAETGWMNFRMRSMLVSFASYHLWLHWRFSGEHLARLFTDFEPGIHWCQMQMQSGTTGINTVRIYNPIKQGYDQDPRGAFIRRWVPELASVSDEFIHEPWKFAASGTNGLFEAQSEPATDYPAPIVDHVEAYRSAQQRIFEIRQRAASRAESRRVYLKHGSRKRPGEPAHRGGPEDRGVR